MPLSTLLTHVRASVSISTVSIVLLTIQGLAAAQTPPQTPLVVATTTSPHTEADRMSTAPKLADYLEGGSHPGHKITGFRQRNPKDLAPATEQTTVYLSYDHDALYIAFDCRASNPSSIRARLSNREDIFADDFVGVYLDTFRDKQRAYEFFTSPRGIQADGIVSATTGDDFSFDAEFSTDAVMTSTGYVALIAIPFKVLRFPVTPDGIQHWGITFVRAIPSNDETDFWPGISNNVANFVAQFGVMDGMSGVSPGRNIQLIPYATFTGARAVNAAGTAYENTSEGRTGLDAKFVLHDALTFDATVNPDFSQVETDDPQVTINQRFEVFFPEKRPFFLENSDIFNDTPQTLFFSRRIGDPQFGVRMTGKVGHWAVGAIAIDDRQPGETADPTSPNAGTRAGDGVFRARYDFENESRVGFLGTASTFGASSNVVASADTRVKLSTRWELDAQFVADADTDINGVHTDGSSTVILLNRSGRAASSSFTYFDASPSFHSTLGFIPRVNYRQATEFAAFRWFPKHGPLIDYGPNAFAQITTNWDGRLTDWIVRFPFQLDFKGRTNAFGRYALIRETISGVPLREHEVQLQADTDFVKWIGVSFNYGHGTRPNYTPADGIAPFLGTFTDAAAVIVVRPMPPLRISEEYLFSSLTSRESSPSTGSVFTNPIHRLRVNYQFTRAWSLRAILDYSEVRANPLVIALDRARHFDADVLLTWLLHPGTALYVGYTDGYDNVRLDPTLGLMPTDGQLSSTGRQIFIKSSWLVRF
jgi:hypothetical protein